MSKTGFLLFPYFSFSITASESKDPHPSHNQDIIARTVGYNFFGKKVSSCVIVWKDFGKRYFEIKNWNSYLKLVLVICGVSCGARVNKGPVKRTGPQEQNGCLLDRQTLSSYHLFI